jgi:hypothetical protein
MQNISDPSMKDIANELSSLLFEDCRDRQRIASLMEKLLLSNGKNSNGSKSNGAGAVPPDPAIGIWVPSSRDSHPDYERDVRQKQEWPLWANVHKIHKKGVKKRIVFLGESVARGYFFDPHYTVAAELEQVLNKSSSLPACEVIDLARVSIGMDQLLKVAEACIALQPDALVVFAGNNWFHPLSSKLSNKEFEQEYASHNTDLYTGVKHVIEQKLADRAVIFLAALKERFVDRQVPVVFVIPGFNLKDWESNDVERVLPWLPEDRVSAWLEAKEVAQKALTTGETGLLGSAAAKMVAGAPFNPYGYELLAKFHIANKDQQEAVKCLELARDTGLLSLNSETKPRCYSIIEKTIQSQAPAHGIYTVNLSEIFKTVAGIPGRDLYMDYCHLTVKGIKIAMRHTAHILTGIVGNKAISLENIPESGQQPDDNILSIAHFCAAIHNAHSGQPEGILSYHCQKALSLSGVVKEVMQQYIDFSTRYTNSLLCKSFGDIILDGHVQQYEGGSALAHPRNGKLMDIPLIDIITQSLKAAGMDISGKVNELRKKEHKVGTERVNLLESFYCKDYYGHFVTTPAPAFLQARTTNTTFYFVADADRALSFELIYRTPKRAYPGKKIKVCLNDESNIVVEMEMSRKWEKQVFSIAKGRKDGINKIIIVWPYTFEPFEPEGGIFANTLVKAMFPVLGEIHGFSVVVPRDVRSPEVPARSAALEKNTL